VKPAHPGSKLELVFEKPPFPIERGEL